MYYLSYNSDFLLKLIEVCNIAEKVTKFEVSTTFKCKSCGYETSGPTDQRNHFSENIEGSKSISEVLLRGVSVSGQEAHKTTEEMSRIF